MTSATLNHISFQRRVYIRFLNVNSILLRSPSIKTYWTRCRCLIHCSTGSYTLLTKYQTPVRSLYLGFRVEVFRVWDLSSTVGFVLSTEGTRLSAFKRAARLNQTLIPNSSTLNWSQTLIPNSSTLNPYSYSSTLNWSTCLSTSRRPPGCRNTRANFYRAPRAFDPQMTIDHLSDDEPIQKRYTGLKWGQGLDPNKPGFGVFRIRRI